MPDNKIIGSKLERNMLLERADDDNLKPRQMWISVSSEVAVDRWFGPEVLVHDEKSIDMEFFAGGSAPLLLDHDPRRQIGVVENVRLDTKANKLRALVRFSKNAMASEVYDDVEDNIRKNVSVGYSITKVEREEKGGELVSMRVVGWKPMEVSIVSIPADETVGVGRAQADLENPKPKTEAIMPEDKKPAEPLTRAAAPVDVAEITRLATEAAVRDAGVTAEKRAEEVSSIIALGQAHNMVAEASEAIKEARSYSVFQGTVLAKIGTDTPLHRNEIGLTSEETQNFSIFRLARANQNGASRSIIDAAAFEIEACAAAAESHEGRANGIVMPGEVMDNYITPEMGRALGMPMQRTLLAGTDTQLIPTEHRAQSFIELLRNAAVTMQAGARTLPGLSGNVDIPRMATSAGATWISAEHGDSTDGEPTFETVSLTPNDLSVSVPMSRRMRQQSSPAIEGLVRMDILQSMALGLDIAVLEGAGSGGVPEGVLNTTGINKPTAFAGVNPTFAEVVAMETAVADDNALFGSLAYIGRTNMRGALKTTVKDAGSGLFVMEGNSMNGYPYLSTNAITDGNLYFGNWADVLIGMWGGLDLVFDDATLAAKNGLYIRAFQTTDVAVRHPVSFAYNNDT